MTMRRGVIYQCDRCECDATVSILLDGESVVDALQERGWSYSTADGKLRHFCVEHTERPAKVRRLVSVV
jgi:hypothetical protein